MEILPVPLNFRNDSVIGEQLKVTDVIAAGDLQQELSIKGIKPQATFTIKSINHGNYTLEVDGFGESIIPANITSRIFNIKI